MRILFLNPNTSEAFTQKIDEVARRYANPETVITTLNPSSGPRTIESVYDELLSVPGTLQAILSERDRQDAIAIACYSDHPALYAAREITDKPVLGIAEASMYVACMLGSRFSVVSTNDEWQPLLWAAVRRYGLIDRCASVRTIGVPVLALEKMSDIEVRSLVENTARKAIDDDDADVVCLGCAGMAGLDKDLESSLHVPVLDGVVCSLKLLEGLTAYGVHTSKRKTYARPRSKELIGLSPAYSEGYAHAR